MIKKPKIKRNNITSLFSNQIKLINQTNKLDLFFFFKI